MKLTQISTLLNNTIVPNLLGEETTISADLNNINDLGVAIADLDDADVKSYAGDFIAGVAKSWFDDRRWEGSDYGLFIDSREFGGVVQRVKARMSQASDSPIWTLQNGTDYFDGVYHGIETSNRVYTKDVIFKVANSIPTEMFKQAFTSADDVSSLISTIESMIDNTIQTELHGLAKSIFQTIAVKGNEIKLLTLYNSLASTSLTAGEALHNASFLRWCAEQIMRLRDMVRDVNKKYNDGTIETFTPERDIHTVMLSEFTRAIQYNMQADTFHNDLVEYGEHYNINFWQNSGTGLLPSLGVTAEVKIKGDDGETDVTKSNIVTIIHDRYTAGMSARINKITAQYIANGDFTTYYHHIAKSHFIDTRNTAIVLTLT